MIKDIQGKIIHLIEHEELLVLVNKRPILHYIVPKAKYAKVKVEIITIPEGC